MHRLQHLAQSWERKGQQKCTDMWVYFTQVLQQNTGTDELCDNVFTPINHTDNCFHESWGKRLPAVLRLSMSKHLQM